MHLPNRWAIGGCPTWQVCSNTLSWAYSDPPICQPAWPPLVLAPSKVYKGHPERPQSSKEIWDYLWRVRPCCVWTTGSSDYEWPFAPLLNTVTCTSKLLGASKSTRRCDKASLPVQLSSSFFFWLKPENITPMPPSLSNIHIISHVSCVFLRASYHQGSCQNRKISVMYYVSLKIWCATKAWEYHCAQPIWSRLLAGLTAVDGAPPHKLHACHGTGSSDSPGETQWMRKVKGLREDKLQLQYINMRIWAPRCFTNWVRHR